MKEQKEGGSPVHVVVVVMQANGRKNGHNRLSDKSGGGTGVSKVTRTHSVCASLALCVSETFGGKGVREFRVARGEGMRGRDWRWW